MHVNILGCGIFAAVSGSSAATEATIGKMAIPKLKKRGYDENMMIGTLAGSGTLGLLIPPSIILIVYGVGTDQSIARLFIAGVTPGIMLVSLFMGYVSLWSLFNPSKVPAADIHRSRRSQDQGCLLRCKFLRHKKWAKGHDVEKIGRIIPNCDGSGIIDQVGDGVSKDRIQQVKSIAGSEGVDRIFEGSFGANIDFDADVLAHHGIIAAFGFDDVGAQSMPHLPLMLKNALLRYIAIFFISQEAKEATFNQINQLVSTGRIQHRIGHIFAFDELPKAHQAIETKRVFGAGLVKVEGS